MKKVMRVLAIVLSLALVMGCLTACGNKADGNKSDSSAIKIGGIGPITGAAAVYGQAVKNAAELAVEEINALDDGIKFEYKFEDDEHDAEKSVNAYNTLKDWGMQILCGCVTSTPCTAVAAESYNDRIFTLTPSASSTDVTKDKDNVFQLCFSDPNQGTASAQYISEQNLGTKVAIIYNNGDNYSTGIYQKFKAEAETRGLEIVSVETFPSDDTTDFKTQLGAAKNAGADILFLPIYYTPASLILKQASDMKFDVKVFGVDGMDGILTLKNFDTSLAEGVMLLTPFSADATDDHTASFVKKYEEKYGETPIQFAADAYDCIYALYNACKSQGITNDMSNEEICKKLISQFTDSSFTFDGLTGDGMQWNDKGEVTKPPKGMRIENGKYVGM